MKKKKLIVILVVFLVGVVAIFLRTAVKNPISMQLETVKGTAIYVDVIHNNMLYNNFYKRLDRPLLIGLIESIELESFEEIPKKTFGNKSDGRWNTWFRFYDSDALIYTITQYADGRICLNGEWYVHLTKESKDKLEKLLVSIGLTGDLTLLPQAKNITAVSNVIFRKDSTVPYVMNDVVFIMPNEQFSVGIAEYGEDADSPGYHRVHYREDQNYDDSLNLQFYKRNSTPEKHQARFDIINNSASRIGLELNFLTSEEVNYGAELLEVGRGEVLSIEVDSDATCCVLAGIRQLWDSGVAASKLLEESTPSDN